MVLHRNAKLGLAGRYALARAVEEGLSLRRGSGGLQRVAGDRLSLVASLAPGESEERATLACLQDRSSRPRRMPRLLAAAEQRRICAARRRTGWGPRLLTTRVSDPCFALEHESSEASLRPVDEGVEGGEFGLSADDLEHHPVERS